LTNSDRRKQEFVQFLEMFIEDEQAKYLNGATFPVHATG
jgi:hypothetical protein